MNTLTNRIKHIGFLLLLVSAVSVSAASPAAAQVTIGGIEVPAYDYGMGARRSPITVGCQ